MYTRWMDLYCNFEKKKKKKLDKICYVAHIIFFHDPRCIQLLENLLAAVSF